MSNSNDSRSDLKQAVDNVDIDDLKSNLQQNDAKESPKSLSDNEQTPFIEDESRTDQ